MSRIFCGSFGHLAIEHFKAMAGVDFKIVQFKGGGPTVVDTVGGPAVQTGSISFVPKRADPTNAHTVPQTIQEVTPPQDLPAARSGRRANAIPFQPPHESADRSPNKPPSLHRGGLAGASFGSFIAHIFSRRRDRNNDFKKAKQDFTEAFLDEVVRFERSGPIEIEGTKIYDVLTRAYPKHCIAVHRFRSQLQLNSPKTITEFEKTWKEYQYPSIGNKQGVFGYYITPDEKGHNRLFKPEFVLERINDLTKHATS